MDRGDVRGLILQYGQDAGAFRARVWAPLSEFQGPTARNSLWWNIRDVSYVTGAWGALPGPDCELLFPDRILFGTAEMIISSP